MMNATSLAERLPLEMTELRWRPLMNFAIDVAPPSIIGMTPGYDRRIGEITGGTFEGERLRGKFRTGGSDWQSLRADGAITINVRVVMETDDGALVGMRYRGVRHGPKEVIERLAKGELVNPNDYYFRVTPWFETSAEKYDWLNRVIAVAIGHRLPQGPIYSVFEIM
jgi:hypothetical protein